MLVTAILFYHSVFIASELGHSRALFSNSNPVTISGLVLTDSVAHLTQLASSNG